MGAKAYNLNAYAGTHGGIPWTVIGGAAEDEFFSLEPKQPAYTSQEGADGSLSFSATNSKYVEIKISLMQTSDGNAVFSAFLALDQAQNGGAGIVPGALKDLNGTTLIAYSQGRIMGRPKLPGSKEAKAVEWLIGCYCEIYLIGGN